MKKDTSWKQVGNWYDELVSKQGHTYHQELIFPNLQRWCQWKEGDRVLDLGCGQGVLARHLPQDIDYVGIDAAAPLIKKAQEYSSHNFMVGDVTKPLNVKEEFTHAFVILALQNIAEGSKVIANGAKHLKKGGKLILILNHPCFRIPRQSSWGIDEDKKIQYRRIDRYMTFLEIPIHMHPSEQEKSSKTFSYHHPLSTYITWLTQNGFALTRLEEWCSTKKSTGKFQKMENRAKDEFPLFLAVEGTLG